ncbi:MAG: ACT domain-containing protein [Acidimicrobiia bacterium]|nr:ACT domain-containing protein [Acidimicrobiia bacterium]
MTSEATTPPGETDLETMLGALAVERRAGVFTFVAVEVPTPRLLAAAAAMVGEGELTTLVLPVEAATRAGLPVTVEMAWLTVQVYSSLEAVGLTAAMSARLTDQGIACNVLAGYHHDHILVPLARVDDATAALTALSAD